MQTHSTMKAIAEGMKVFDLNNKEIGRVEYVRFGDDDPDTIHTESADLSEMGDRDTTIIDDIATAFAADDDLPDEMQERLLHQGFVRIDSDGLFAADRYIMPEQIASVSGDSLMLNVTKDELLKKH
jgi:hypothetical protein